MDLGGPSVYPGRRNLKLSTKATVFKRVNLLIEGPSMLIGGGQALPWRRLCTEVYSAYCWSRFFIMSSRDVSKLSS